MSDRRPGPGPTPRTTTPTSDTTFLRKLHTNSPISTQLLGFLALAISGTILLLLTGLTLTATILALIFFTPLIILTSPIWVPAGTVIFLAFAGLLCTGVLGLAVLTATSWTYKYVRVWHPPGSDRIDYARTRIADTANNVRDYAREYGGYLQRKVKDAAPGA